MSIWQRVLRLCMDLFVISLCLMIGSFRVANANPHEKSIILAEESLAAGDLDKALNLYEKALKVFINHGGAARDDAELGKLHSRMGQLYIKKMRGEPRPEYSLEYKSRAAFHYIQCTQSKELSSMLKASVCSPQVRQLTAPLQVIGQPHQLIITHPQFFRGPAQNGQLVPKGLISIEFKKKVNSPVEQRLLKVPMEQPLDFTERDFMPARPLLDDPTGLVIRPHLGDPNYSKFVNKTRVVPRLPGYVLVGVGSISLVTPIVMNIAEVANGMGDQGVSILYLAGVISIGLGSGWLVWAW